MKKLNLLLAAICILHVQNPVARAQAQSMSTFSHMVLENTKLVPLHSDITGRDYLLYIGYPDSYRDHPERKYPVVYITDAYWNFIKMYSIGSSLWYDHLAPEYILVGIGYTGVNVDYEKERMFELSPSRQDYDWCAGMTCRMGGSRQFLDAIKKEIITYVETNTQADSSFRVLVGASMGGLFSLYAMYEEPGLFDGVIAGSPVVDWDHCWLFKRESELRAKALGIDNRGLFCIPSRLFMSVGGEEDHLFIGYIRAMNEIISDTGYKDFDYEFRVVEGEKHASNCTESFNRGIRFVFKKDMARIQQLNNKP